MMEHGMGMPMMGWQMGFGWLFGGLVYVALVVVPFWQLWRRTGHSGWVSLLMLVPLVNLVLLWVLAFKDWPIAPHGAGGRS